MSHPNPFKDRLGLGAYISTPSSFPPSIVIYQNDDFVAIHDKYPKATIHTLLLPRSPTHNLLHPYEAFRDAAFLEKVQRETMKLKALVAAELERRLGQYSKTDAARQAVLNGERETEDGQLPRGRDWGREVKVGVHAVPSMTHLHIHVLSRDMHSASMRHRKHYNSFNTPFLVDVKDFPMADEDPRLNPKGEGYLRRDLKCWRCGRGFGNSFVKLKEHLEGEFAAWRAD
jgi:aprataxin